MEEPVCRVCMGSSVTLVDIYDGQPMSDEEPSLAEMLNECVACELRPDDPLPKQICLSCVCDAQNAYRFKRTCEQSHRLFWEQFRKDMHLKEMIETEDWQLSDCSLDMDCIKIEETQIDGEEKGLHKDEEKKKLEVIKEEEQPTTSRAASQLRVKPSTDINKITITTSAGVDTGTSVAAGTGTGTRLSGRIYRCEICGKELFTIAKLIHHRILHKEGICAFECHLCPAKFALISLLKKHMRIHIDKRPHKCPFCPKIFTRKQNADEHIARHKGRIFKCSQCEKDFKSHVGFRYHACLPAVNELRTAHLSLACRTTYS